MARSVSGSCSARSLGEGSPRVRVASTVLVGRHIVEGGAQGTSPLGRLASRTAQLVTASCESCLLRTYLDLPRGGDRLAKVWRQRQTRGPLCSAPPQKCWPARATFTAKFPRRCLQQHYFKPNLIERSTGVTLGAQCSVWQAPIDPVGSVPI